MSADTKRPWVTASNEVQLATLRQALEAAAGNITQAAAAIGINRSHATRLVKKLALGAWAAELRRLAGNQGRGRPWHSKAEK